MYADEYNIHKCDMMLAKVLLGSFIITWFIPEYIVAIIKSKLPRAILEQYSFRLLAPASIIHVHFRR